MEPTNYLIATTLIAGVVQLIKKAVDRDFRSVAIIGGAAVAGGVLGYFGTDGLTIPLGIMLGFATSGLVTIGQKIGQKS